MIRSDARIGAVVEVRLALGIQAPTLVMSARIAKVTMILVRFEN